MSRSELLPTQAADPIVAFGGRAFLRGWLGIASVASIVLGALLLQGCASRGDIDSLTDELDALSRSVQTSRTESREALEATRVLEDDIAALRVDVERTARDAAATRRLLETMDARGGPSVGDRSLK